MKTILFTFFITTLLFTDLIEAQGVWTRKADYLGARRYDFIGYALANKGYMGSGTYGGINSFLADWQEFDPVLNAWTQKEPLPMPFKGGTGFVAGSYGYACNGANDATYIFDTYEYNDIGNNWSAKAPFNSVRLYATSTGFGNFGYVIGGYDVMAAPMNDCWEYNQPANTWTQRANLPMSAARYYATSFSVNGKIYLFGGTDGSIMLNDLWQYDPVTDTWAQKASLPGSGRQQAIAFVIGSTAYVIGGFSPAGGSFKECWKYNPALDQWTALANFPGTTGPAGGVGFTISGQGYVVCGNGTAECWEYAPETTGLQEISASSAVRVFPNPAVDFIRISLPEGIFVTSASLISMSGDILQNYTAFRTPDPSIDVRNLKSGLYLITVIASSGAQLSCRFIKKGE
jgi:N-acetylneuraminic acid mutarotase